MFFSLLSRQRKSGTAHVRTRRHQRGFRPELLRLEDRVAPAGLVKVNPGNLDGWTVQKSGTATVTFEAGPAVPPLGEGSVELAVGSNGMSGARVRNFLYAGTRLSSLTTLRYSAYVDNDSTDPPTAPNQAPYLILNIDLDGSFATSGDRHVLIFEPEYQSGYTMAVPPQGPIVMDLWQSWDALIGGWWSPTNVAGAGPGADVKPLSAVIAAHPNAMIVNSLGLTGSGGVQIVAGLGAGAWDNFVGNADAFIIGVSGDTTTYDFDPGPVIGPITDTPDPSNEGQQVSVTATFTDAAPNVVYTATIDWGDGTGPQPATATFNLLTGQGQVTGMHVYQDDNPTGTPSDVYTITVTVMDPAGNAGSGSTLHTVNNVNPVILTMTGPMTPQPVGTPVTVTATFTDQGTQDTHTATINWGDGNTTPGVVTEAGGSGQASGTHTYTQPGVYTVTVTIFDDDGGSDSMSSDEAVPIPFFVVIFDAQGGFITGGGWYNNPATANPPLPGKVHLGFNAKFHTGDVVPRGQLHVNFKPANVKFRSTSFSFMSVTGNTAHLRGKGTNNGAGEFFFRMDVADNGEPGRDDTFKIKIYRKLDDLGLIETDILYENPLPTKLDGGNIQIHHGTTGLRVDGEAGDGAAGHTLTKEALDSAITEALVWWAGEGVDAAALAALGAARVHIVQLPDAWIGIAGNAAIGLDEDAAGFGWAINGANGGLNLATVVRHELGHLLGLDHGDHRPVMAASLEPPTPRAHPVDRRGSVVTSASDVAPVDFMSASRILALTLRGGTDGLQISAVPGAGGPPVYFRAAADTSRPAAVWLSPDIRMAGGLVADASRTSGASSASLGSRGRSGTADTDTRPAWSPEEGKAEELLAVAWPWSDADAERAFAAARWREACDVCFADGRWQSDEGTGHVRHGAAAMLAVVGALGGGWWGGPAIRADDRRRRVQLGGHA